MSTPIRIKRSAVPGKIPTTADLQLSELAINTYDGKIYLKRDQSGVETVLTAGSGYPGNTYYVSKAGLDTNDGKSLSSSFLTLKYALSIAVSGDTVQISAGTYSEIFPLTVPQGVTIQGNGLRSTFIQPTAGTQRLDAFLLNGETTIQDLSVGNFYYNSSANTGYGFRFANNMITTIRSPYIQRVTVLNRGSLTSESDPYGYDTPDNYPSSLVSGRGVLIDGSVVQSTTLEPAILFNECTFITPNQTSLRMINGARSEWVNCFTYFSSKGIEGISGPVGVASTANITLRLSGITTSSLSQNYVIKYYQSGSPVAIGTIVSTSGIVTNTPYITLLGKGSGVFNSVGIGSVQDIRIFQSNGSTQVGTASTILWADYQKFGADLRSIGSADNFGEYGVNADGPGVQLRLFGFNFGCVGSGKTFTQDPTLTIKSNEANQTNGGRVYFQSVDQAGNFRVGNIFEISQETGAVSLASTSDITINGTATIQNLTVAGISTFLNPVEFDSNLFVSGISTFNNNVKVTGFTTFVSDSMFSNNLNVAGITTSNTLRVTGISTLTGDTEFTNNVRVSGISTLTNLRVTGISTLTGDTEFTNNVRVSGITTATTLRVTGISTLTGDTEFTNNIRVSGITTATTLRVTGISTLTGDTEFTNNIRVSGISTLTNLRVTGISTLTGDTEFTNNVRVSGISTLTNLIVTGVGTLTALRVTGISTLTGDTEFTNNIRVSGISTLTNLRVTGISTLTGDTEFTNNVRVSGITTATTLRVTGISTFTGDTEFTNNVRVSGISTLTNLIVTGVSTLTTLRVTGISTLTGDTEFTNNVRVSGITTATTLRVTGISTLTGDTEFTNNVRVSGITTATTLRVTGISTFTGNVILDNSLKVVGITTLGAFTFNNSSVGVITGPSQIIIDPATVGNNTGSVRIAGDFYVDGTTTTVNSTTLEIGDISIGIGTTAIGNDTLASGGGIVLHGASDKSLAWILATNSWTSSENFNLESTKVYKIAGTQLLSEQQLTVPYSNISGLSTLGNLNVTGIGSVSTFYSNVGYSTNLTVSNLGVITHFSATHLKVTGISSLANVQIGFGNTALIVSGDARITGILTIGTSSITLRGTSEEISVGNTTRIHTSGFDIGNSFVHSSGIAANNLNVGGIATVATLYVSGISTFNGQVTASSIQVTGGGINIFSRAEVTDLYVGVGSISTLKVNSGVTTSSTVTYENVTGILTAVNVNVSSAATIGIVTISNYLHSKIAGIGSLTTNSAFYALGISSIRTLLVNTGLSTSFTATRLSAGDISVSSAATITSFLKVLGTSEFIGNVNASGITTIITLDSSTITNTTLNNSTFNSNLGITTQAVITNANITGILTAVNVNVSSAATISNIVSNSANITNLFSTNLSAESTSTLIGITTQVQIGINTNLIGINTSGINIDDEITSQSFPSQNKVSGFTTNTNPIYIITTNFSTNVAISTNDTVTVVRNNTLGIGSISTLKVNSGIVTSAIITRLNVSGIATITDLNVSGCTTSLKLISNIGIVTYFNSDYFNSDYLYTDSTSVGIKTTSSILGISTNQVGINTTGIIVGDTVTATSIPAGSIVVGFSTNTASVIISNFTLNTSGISTEDIGIYRSNNAGIGSISTLKVNSGIVTSAIITRLNVSGIATITNLNVSNVVIGVATVGSFISTDVYVTGITTADLLYSNSGIVTNLNVTRLNVTGIATLANLRSTNVEIIGISTIKNIRIDSGIATDFSGKYLTYTNTSSVIVSSSITIGISTNRIGITTTNVQVGDSITSVGGDFSNETQVTSIEPGIVVFSPNSVNISSSTSLVSITRSNNVGIVTASTLYVNSGVATVFDITQSIIGVGTISRLISSGILVSGITTTNSLYSNTGIITHVSGTNLNYTGIATLTTAALTNLYSNSGIVTHISGTNIAYSGIGTIDQLSGSGIAYTTANFISIGASALSISGVSSLSNIRVNSGIVTYLSGTHLSYSGIGTIDTLYSNIGFTTYLSGTNLNYIGVGSIATLIGTGVTFNSADFTNTRTTSLYGTGIGSIATLYVNSGFVTTLSGTQLTYTNANVTGVTTSSLVYSNVGVVTFISGTNIAYSGIGTIDQLSGTGIAYTSADLTHVRSQNIRATGIGTIDSLYSNVGVVTTLSGTRSTYQDIDNTNLYTSGVGSISTLKSNVGLVTFVSGINLSYSGVGTITSLYGSDIAYSGVGTIGTLYSNIGFVTTLSGTNLNYSGIGSIQNLYVNVGVVTYLTGTNLNYSGVGTITQILSVNAQNSGIITSSSLHVGVGGSIISVVSGIGSVGIGTTAAKEKLNIYGNLLYSNNVTTGTSRVGIATTSLTTIHEAFSRLEYRSVEYQIQASCSGAGNTGRYQFTKILSIHDGTAAFNVEYSTVGTGTDVSSYVVDIDEGLDAGYIRLQAAPAQVGITSYVVHYVAYKL